MTRTMSAGLLALLAAAPGCTGSESRAAAAATNVRPARSGDVVRFDATSPQLERIRVMPVIDAVLPVDEIDLAGRIEAVPTRLARLALPVPGRVRSIDTTLGDHVRQGQVLATIETPDVSALQSAWRQAQADVRQREAAAAKADADLDRMRDLIANRAAARKDVLAAEAERAAATASLEQALAAREDVARRLRLFGVDGERADAVATMRSPMAGEIVEMAMARGEYRGDTAAPVLSVADLSRVWVVAAVPERAVARVQAGQRVAVAVAAYPDDTFDGVVARVAGTLDADTRSARIFVELDNRRGLLKPGMFARVRYSGPARAVVTVAAGAIVQDTARTTVFVERTPGEFERRDVGLGPRHGDAVVVASGLVSGDRVVVAGTMLLMGQ